MIANGAGFSDASTANSASAEALGGRYQIISEVGKGAFGTVYKARDAVLNRTVAVKHIRLDAIADRAQLDEHRQRFQREAQVAAQLRHPNIVIIHDIVSTPETSFIVMEFVDGATLQSLLATRKRLSFSDTVNILSQVAEALDHAHQYKVVHRDIKPANIIIHPSGQVKVTDFGLAKADYSSEVTVSGNIMGTPNYMSPEQIEGRKLDGRSDLFSLGCVLYECLVGSKAFPGSALTAILMGITQGERPSIDCMKHGLPSALQDLLAHLLAKEPSQRFASAAEFARALRSIPPAPVSEESGEGARDDSTASGAPSVETTGKAPDSVADTLMMEARSTARIRPQLKSLLAEKRRLRLLCSPLLQFRNVTLTPAEAYLLSRIDGNSLSREIFALSPVPEEDTARTLLGLLRAGIIGFEEPVPDDGTVQLASESSPAPTGSDDAHRQEIKEVFDLSQGQDNWQILGVGRDASLSDIKRAFHEKAFRYHPDRYRGIDDPDFQMKLGELFRRISDAFGVLSKQIPGK